jgi:hypothetical protein
MGVFSTGIQRFFNKPASFQTSKGETSERELQSKLYGLFFGMHNMGIENVKRAYFADVQYEGLSNERLALCLVADRDYAEHTASEIGKVFEQTHARGELDILFISGTQEQQIRDVCQPFFSAL